MSIFSTKSSMVYQNIMDVWHQSEEKSWDQFVNNSALNYLRENHKESFDKLENYQSQFTRNIYSPLSEYLASQRHVFKGTANSLIKQILVIYNHLKSHKVAPNCCMQIDMRSRHDIIARYENNQKQDEERKIETTFSMENLENLMTDRISSFSGDVNECYKKYEILIMYGSIIKFNTVKNNIIPQCMICNTINGEVLSQNLITFSFHVYHDCIKVYVLISDGNGKLYGSRIFTKDLLCLIPLLFEDKKIAMNIRDKLQNELHFEMDKIYKQYYLYLVEDGVISNTPLGINEMDDAIAYIKHNNPNRKKFCKIMKNKYNTALGISIKIYRGFIFSEQLNKSIQEQAITYHKKTNRLCSGQLRILNFDFYDKETNEILYCIVDKKYNENNEYQWRMRDKLFTTDEIEKYFGISNDKLPQSSRGQQSFINELNHEDNIKKLLKNKSQQQIIDKINWNNIPIICSNNNNNNNGKNNKRRISLSIKMQEFKNDLNQFISNDNDKNNIIPIVIFDDDDREYQYHIEYVYIIKIDNDSIGISYEYDQKKNTIKPTAIYLNKKFIKQQHNLINPDHECHCLDDFVTDIDDLEFIQDTNDEYEQILYYKNRCKKLEEFMENSIEYINKISSNDININKTAQQLYKWSQIAKTITLNDDNADINSDLSSLYPVDLITKTPINVSQNQNQTWSNSKYL